MDGIYSADFETNNNEDDCRVWAWGMINIFTEKYIEGNSIDSFMKQILGKPIVIYFTNLAFDGEFILHWLFNNKFKYTEKPVRSKQFRTIISEFGRWYELRICYRGTITVIREMLNLVNMSVEDMANRFKLEQKKGIIDYSDREINHTITEEEHDYLHNDVLIPAKILRLLYESDIKSMTLGVAAMKMYKNMIGTDEYNRLFPNIREHDEMRKAYRGGYTYLNKKYKNIDIGKGLVLDVNSMYPACMKYCKLPYGVPKIVKGRYNGDTKDHVYIQVLSCVFELKKNKLPTIQLKKNFMFASNEYLENSDGNIVTLYLTNLDLDLFLEHYNIYCVTWHYAWVFNAKVGLFDKYIDYWIDVKVTSEKDGNYGMRQLSKLMLNILYGKFGTALERRSKIPYMEDGEIHYKSSEIEHVDGDYLPVAIFTTAYARDKIIRSAMAVYDRFIYADTDSLHLEGTGYPTGVDIDPYRLGAWKIENKFNQARFIKQKTYIEMFGDDLTVKAAGMSKPAKRNVTYDNFKVGFHIQGNLKKKRVKGGIMLYDNEFTIKD